jgi:hypothetical protein
MLLVIGAQKFWAGCCNMYVARVHINVICTLQDVAKLGESTSMGEVSEVVLVRGAFHTAERLIINVASSFRNRAMSTSLKLNWCIYEMNDLNWLFWLP